MNSPSVYHSENGCGVRIHSPSVYRYEEGCAVWRNSPSVYRSEEWEGYIGFASGVALHWGQRPEVPPMQPVLSLYRYPDDVYDRIWMPYNSDGWAKPNTSHVNNSIVSIDSYGSFQPPSTVMKTAASPANASEDEYVHITRWVMDDKLRNGDITEIVDPILEGDFETNSAWKAVELALACASHVSSKRPAMNEVVMELKECLAMETARKKNGCGSEASSSA
ncbi:hypothetical protein EZV62_003650 [Acer yangbiense]|uniref:Malectin-like domain-containing protein n=1 Tax=Acer yangbiense TaxID=1000413 RepID=A0A5C7II07_9ROSI|nr:hypothetical protein EZV62_003650 [Acer yangbiense]